MDLTGGGVRGLRVNTAAVGVNFIDITPGATTAGATVASSGSDTNVPLILDTKGTGIISLRVGTVERLRVVGTLTANAFIYSGTSSALTSTAAPTNGQLLIGSTGAAPVAAALTAGAGGVTITNGAGSITINHPISVVAKSADETVNNSSTLQNDDALLFSLAANTTYAVKLVLTLTAANATADWKFGFTAPAAATMNWDVFTTPSIGGGAYTSGWAGAGTANAATVLQTISGNAPIGSGAFIHGAIIEGVVYNGANTGNLQFQWAQNTANATNSVVNAGSYMFVTKLY